ncbi:hypothetical protein NE237_006098 [Protea cynaroides]|uniref:Cytochrome P450 n=1 Tax=Protea cynaroides TaxID=273540 RepID=A0A9Q0KMG3_9MAGN|nr:hypothetical protein NE237_006098 [Protea cynaroides]
METLLQFPTVMFFFFLIFSYYLLQWRSSNTNKRLAPEAAGAWPIIALTDRYGPAFAIRLGMQPALVVSSWEVAKECFRTNDRALATRPKAIATKLMGYNYALFSFIHYGNYWREIQKIVTLELLSNRRLEMLKHVRASEIKAFIKGLYNGGHNAGLVDMKKWFGDLTLDIIVRMVAGKLYFGVESSTADAEEALLTTRRRFESHYMGLFVVSDVFPFLEGLDLQGYEKAMRRTAKNLDSIVEGWLNEHKQKRLFADNDKAKSGPNFMDVMISIMEGSKLDDYDNMILGANDTTVVTFTWLLSLLINNPLTLKRAQDELDMHVGRERQETLCLYPAAPLAAAHEAIEECTIAGYHVAVGTLIIPNLYKIHRDPRIWFLTNHLNIDLRGEPVDMTESLGLTNMKATPLEVLLSPRLPPKLYE